jgi:AbrB family looped-hinge helix DNA binding protein
MKTTVTVSPKYQIVIPQEVRERMGIRPGQKVTFIEWMGAFAVVPVMDASAAHGFLLRSQNAAGVVGREKDFGDDEVREAEG